MNPKNFQRQIVGLLIVAIAVVVGLATVYYFQSSLMSYLMTHMAQHEMAERVLAALKVILWATLALVCVKIASAVIFNISFRLRKGYEVPSLIRNLFSIITFIICFVIIFEHYYPNINLGALFTTSAIFGVIIGLALQDTLGNLFAGISVHADKPFQVGDVIAVGQGRIGVVESISWRAVKLRTFQNHILMMSNSAVAKEVIEVCPRNNLNARIVYFTTAYTDSPAKTVHVVREAIRGAHNVSQKLTPIVRIHNLGDSTIEWEVKYWLDDYARHNDSDAMVRQLIWYTFRRNKIEFGGPTRTVVIQQSETPDSMQRDARGFIDRLSAVDVFAPLTEEEMSVLAEAATSHVFAAGEFVIRAGDAGSSMFVVHRGSVKVQINDNGTARSVAILEEGDFFGEMALFTGEPRTANIVAAEETEVLEIGHNAVKMLFEANPDLVESLSHVIAERRAGLAASAENSTPAAADTAGILSSIRRFFGMSATSDRH